MCARSVGLEPFTGGGQGQNNDQQERDCIFTCKLFCCRCSFCHRVAAKERHKSQLLSKLHRNKICERCFLCRSLEFCKSCHKCPSCCYNSTCRVKVTSVLGEVGALGLSSKVVTILREGYTLHFQFRPNHVTNCHKQLCQSTETVQPFGGTVSADEQKCSGSGSKPKLTGFLQPAIFGTQTQPPVETYPGPEHLEHLPKHRVVQNGDPRDNKNLPTARGVGHLHRLQGRILPYTNSQSVREVHAFSHPGSALPVQSPTIWPVHSTYGVHSGGQRGQTDGFTERYKNPPVPRRLVGESHIPPNLSPAYTDLGSSLSRTRLAGEQGEVRTGPKTGFQLRRLPVPVTSYSGRARSDPHQSVADLNRQDIVNPVRSGVPGPAVHVPHRTSNSHRKASPSRSTSYETHTVALEEQLEGTRITRKGDTRSQVAPPPFKVVAGGKQCASRSTITPTKTCSADIYRRIKRRVGRSLKQTHCKGNLVPSRKQVIHKPLGTKGGLSGPKRVPRPLFKQHSPGSHRQHNSGCLYQQGRGDEVGLPMCRTVENPVLVHQETGNSLGTSHPRPAERDSRQAIQTWPDHSNRMVPSPRSVSSYMLPVAPASSGLVCHQIQQQTPTVCVTGPRPPGLGSRCTQPVLGKSGPICLPTSSHLGQSGGEVTGPRLQQDHFDRPGVAHIALGLGSSGNVQSDPSVSAQPAQSGISTFQPDPAQEPVKPELTCLAPRATAIKEQGFSEAVAARIEAPQKGSTRSVYEAKWTIFTKWCLSNQVDFRAPPLKAIADFLLHLFQDRKLQPGTIDGYRSVIADKLGNSTINAKMRISPVSWIVSIETDPRAGGVYPPGTCPWSYTS